MLVFPQGLMCTPRSTAFFASKPAPIINEGFEVFVQLVMAAMTTAPLERSNASPLLRTGTLFEGAPSTTLVNEDSACRSGTRSCGRLVPATADPTVPGSSYTL